MEKYYVSIIASRCKSCGFCQELCPAGVLERTGALNESGYSYMSAVRQDDCTGCMRCLTQCPDFAISLHEREK